MHHVAIMKKSWGLLPKILDGEKVIESRWYKNRTLAWDKVQKGDTIFFKNSGEPVTVRASVSRVLQFSDLTPKKVKEILQEYGQKDGIAQADLPHYAQMFKDKRYCLLIFLSGVKAIKPFDVTKKGFGAMASWLTVKNIDSIKI